ncbi:fasciclin domain-containing protein [Aquipuribacter nitratireducens]|uniref:Fasciclin domain-containing protein n=1 Tax=Aquipuribacter nitratireducens TaxID=650104 RepID=A0ABW0GLG3_9MICO
MKRHLRLAPVAVTAALVLAACGGAAEDATTDATGAAGDAVDTATQEADDMASDMATDMAEDMGSEEPVDDASDAAAMGGPVGPGCEQFATEIAPEGEGSVEGMSDDPVAVAASNNPILTTLTAAVSGELNPDVDLVDTLNGDEFTVFAPVDDAFAADVDEATLATLQEDADLLSTILTYHVVPGQIAPEELAGTTQTTVQGGTVEVTGEPDMLMVNGANVICGGVTTANATVYLIDGVLMPTS